MVQSVMASGGSMQDPNHSPLNSKEFDAFMAGLQATKHMTNVCFLPLRRNP